MATWKRHRARGASALEAMVGVAIAVVVGAALLLVFGLGLGDGAARQARCIVGLSSGQTCDDKAPAQKGQVDPGTLALATGEMTCDQFGCRGGTSCFVAGTLVAVPGGLLPIESLAAGDAVSTRAPSEATTAAHAIVGTKRTAGQPVVDIAFGNDGEHLRATLTHPFFVVGRGFVPAGELAPGDPLDVGGGQARVVGLTLLAKTEDVFNLEVADVHTYLVGAAGVLVHNDCAKEKNALTQVAAALAGGKLTVVVDARKRTASVTRGANRVVFGYPDDTAEDASSITIVKDGTTTTWKVTGRDTDGNRIWSDGKGQWIGYVGSRDGDVGLSTRRGKDILHAIGVKDAGITTFVDPAEVEKELAANEAREAEIAAAERARLRRVRLAEAELLDAKTRILQKKLDDIEQAEAEHKKFKPIVVDDKGRPKKITSPKGLVTDVEYDDKGAVVLVTFTDRDGGKVTWKRVEGPDRRNFTAYRSDTGEKLIGGIEVWKDNELTPYGRRVAGAIDILDVEKGKSVTIFPDDGRALTDWTTGTRRVYGTDADKFSVEAEQKDRSFKPVVTFEADKDGFSKVVTPDGTFRRVGNPIDGKWLKDGEKTARSLTFTLVRDRLVTTEWKDGKRLVTERVLGEGGKVYTFRPDEDENDKLLDRKRWELANQNLVPKDTTLAQFRDIYAAGIRSRFISLDKQIGRYSEWMHRLRESRYRDSDGFRAAEAELKHLLAEMKKLRVAAGDPVFVYTPDLDVAKLDYAGFDRVDRASFYDPEDPDSNARGIPKLHKLLESYKGELPGWDERALATVIGVEDGILDMGKSVVKNPVQMAGITILTIAAPEVMIPLMSAYGITKGAATIRDGLREMEKGERDKDAARYLKGWHRMGEGGTEIGVATAGYLAFARGGKFGRVDGAIETSPELLVARTPKQLRPVPEPFVTPPAEVPVPAMPLPEAAPPGTVLRFNAANAWGEIEWIAGALRLDPTLKVRVGVPKKPTAPKQLPGESAEAFAARRAADPKGEIAHQRAVENAARADEYLAREFGDRVYKSTEKMPDGTKVLEGSELAATGTVVRALIENPAQALARLRSPVAGRPIPPNVRAFVDTALADLKPGEPILLIWNRSAATGFGADRAMTPELLSKLIATAEKAGMRPVVVGDAIPSGVAKGRAIDMTGHWKNGVGSQTDQLLMFEYLQMRGTVGQVGMMSGGMDVPALTGMPTLSINAAGTSTRVGHVVGRLPGYKEVSPELVLDLIGKLRGQKVPPIVIPYLPRDPRDPSDARTPVQPLTPLPPR